MTITYCTLDELKQYIGTTSTDDDLLLEQIIDDTTAEIETYTRRKFYTYTETRYFDAWADTNNRLLLVDTDLLSTSVVWCSGNGTYDASDYNLLPLNMTPKYGVQLKLTAPNAYWPYNDDPTAAIWITGDWGYNATGTPPGDIRRAAIRLAAWRYRQKDAPFEQTGIPTAGGDVAFIPAPMPVDIARVLDRYVRQWGSYGV